MRLDDLRTVWQREIERPSTMGEAAMGAIRHDVAKLDRDVKFRDFWMILPLWVVALGQAALSWLNREAAEWLSLAGMLAFLIATVIMTVALIRARHVNRSDDWTMRARIEIEIERIVKQRKLMDNVAYWFLAPILAANVLGSLAGYHARTGSFVPTGSMWAYYIICLVLYGLTYWLVRRDSRKKWDPLLARLRRIHEDLLGGSAMTNSTD